MYPIEFLKHIYSQLNGNGVMLSSVTLWYSHSNSYDDNSQYHNYYDDEDDPQLNVLPPKLSFQSGTHSLELTSPSVEIFCTFIEVIQPLTSVYDLLNVLYHLTFDLLNIFPQAINIWHDDKLYNNTTST